MIGSDQPCPPGLDIYRTASVLIREHGEDASLN
jgi:hypothetical protein